MSMPARFAAVRIAAFCRADTRICIWQVFAAVLTLKSMRDLRIKCQYKRIDSLIDSQRRWMGGKRLAASCAHFGYFPATNRATQREAYRPSLD